MLKLILLFSFVAEISFAMPAQILLMRHGEKPQTGSELNEQGWQRAQAMPLLFKNRPEFTQSGPPAAIYAMAPSKADGSLRAIQTVQYLAKDLGLKTNTEFTKTEVTALVQNISEHSELDGKSVVICWEHKVLLDIAANLGIKNPPDWPGSQFDRVWVLSFSADGKLEKFQDLPEKLLPTDSQD